MNKKVVETDKYCLTENYNGNRDMFMKTEVAPPGYIYWPIGRENFPFPKYIPLAKPIAEFTIDRKDLLALNVHDEEFALWLMNQGIKGKFHNVAEELPKMKELYQKSNL